MKKGLVILDLFSGVGGFTKGFLEAGYSFRKHYFSEINDHAIACYKYNFEEAEYAGKVEEISKGKIERPDIITFGFPCQDLSISGKRNGLAGKRSGLFYEALRIVQEFKPRAFIFENVKGLFSSEGGKDFEEVLKAITNIGLYNGQWQLLNTSWFLPQNRERVYFVGTSGKVPAPKIFPISPNGKRNKKNLNQEKGQEINFYNLKSDKYNRTGAHKTAQNSRIYFTSYYSPTLTSNGSVKIYQGKQIRRLTPVEFERLQGFPDGWTKYGVYDDEVREIADTHRYELMGNAVSIPLVEEIAVRLKGYLESDKISNVMEQELEGIGKKSKSVPEIKFTYSSEGKRPSVSIHSSEDVSNFMKDVYDKDTVELQEQFYVIYLNRANKIKGYYKHTVGGIEHTLADIRIVMAGALKTLSSSIILVHNHPSGNTAPSESDKKLTQRFKEAALFFDINILDHIIITADGYYSFADQGYLMGLDSQASSSENSDLIEEESTASFDTGDSSIKSIDSFAKVGVKKYRSKVKGSELKTQEKKKKSYSIEIKIIEEFIKLNKKDKTPEEILSIIQKLQDAINKKTISIKSPFASEVEDIQEKLIRLYNSIRRRKVIRINIDESLIAKYRAKIKKFKIVVRKPLSGLENDVSNKLIEVKKTAGVINSLDFIKVKFEGIGFKGKWKDFIGDPSRGFTTMVFGKPKFGKSYLCIEFAGYLARNHGKVLYVAKEEELDATLQIKLKDKSVAHPNLFVSDVLPKDLMPYDFIFLDSVTKLNLSPQDLGKLERKNPDKSFVYIFQVRKDGIFKGRNDYQHDVDVVIEVPEKGKAVQNGRFNPGGEMQIFDECVKF